MIERDVQNEIFDSYCLHGVSGPWLGELCLYEVTMSQRNVQTK
jgi:hypothetical protein